MAELKIEKVDPAAYSKFLCDNPPRDPFSLPYFIDAYREAFSCDAELLHIIRNETAVASCALFIAKRFSQPIVTLLPVRTYDGVHFRNLEGSKNQKQEYEKLQVLDALAKYLEKEFAFYQMAFPPELQDIRAFQWGGAKVIPQFTYVVDLSNFSEENYTKSLREVLNAARASGLTAGKCSVEELTAMQQLSYERHGRRAPVQAATVSLLLNKLSSSGKLEITAVRNGEGLPVAALARLQTESASYFYVSGMRPPANDAERGASHLVYHEILNAEKEAGRLRVDFCGANTPSINLFKSAFGPRLETYFRVWRANRFGTRLASLVKKI